MKKYFLLILLLCTLSSFALKEKMEQGKSGDFIVTEQFKNYTILNIHSLTGSILLLEEITVPADQIDHSSSWNEWVAAGAPGHTSWSMFEIDLSTNSLLEGFSFSQMAWLDQEQADPFFAKLLSLPLKAIPSSDQRRIGPAPSAGEMDRRRYWQPPVVIEGRKLEKPSVDPWYTKWPKDSSPLSECRIELYFDKTRPFFPFPIWIEINNGHYAFKVRTVDSGTSLISPIKGGIPRQEPSFLGTSKRLEDSIQLKIQSPIYYKNFQLFAVDLTQNPRQPFSVAFKLQKTADKGIFLIDIPLSQLRPLLKSGHRYQWILAPQEFEAIRVHSTESFSWKE